MVYILLVIGFVCLIEGADFFVDGCSSLARKFHVPTLIIGLTVVAMGTSMPECAVSVSAAVRGIGTMAISNITGSNFFNLLMVCGCCSVIIPLRVQPSCMKKEMPFAIIVTFLLVILSAVGMEVGRWDGILLLAIFVLFLWSSVHDARKSMKEAEPDEEPVEFRWWKCLLCLIGGAAAIVVGGQLVVNSAETIALNFGLSETLIGLTVCAIGTSLPELVTSMVAAHKGEDDMAIGNVIGSNLFNILLIIGLTSAIRPIAVTFENLIDLLLLIDVSLMILLMAMPKKRISRPCGAVCIAVYAAYMVYICLR